MLYVLHVPQDRVPPTYLRKGLLLAHDGGSDVVLPDGLRVLDRPVLQSGVGGIADLAGRQLVVVVQHQHLLQIILDSLPPLALLAALIIVESNEKTTTRK